MLTEFGVGFVALTVLIGFFMGGKKLLEKLLGVEFEFTEYVVLLFLLIAVLLIIFGLSVVIGQALTPLLGLKG